ncbi:MerC domain-containing protein [Sphingomonas sp. KR3-1]|uniref:MerC domain-containing protein n=1 Tax=Sphingomonas sp. KR3-1 TaxID=3156611 RepID=UPI0032B5B172
MHCGQQAAGAPIADWTERAAVGASTLCLIHCAGLPLVFALLPAFSKLVALPESLHVWLLGAAIPSSGVALLLGRARHRAWLPLLAGGAGLGLLAFGALIVIGGPFEAPVTVAGSVALVVAHLVNWRLRHREHPHG